MAARARLGCLRKYNTLDAIMWFGAMRLVTPKLLARNMATYQSDKPQGAKQTSEYVIPSTLRLFGSSPISVGEMG